MANQQSAPVGILSPSGGMYLGINMIDPGTGLQFVLLDTVLSGFNDGIEDTVNNKITVNKAGLYLVYGQAEIGGVVDGQVLNVFIMKNTLTYLAQTYHHAGAAEDITINIGWLGRLAANDEVQLAVELANAANDVFKGSNNTYLFVQWLRS